MKRKKTKERSWWQGGKKEDETQRETQGYGNEGWGEAGREDRHRGLLAHCVNFRTLHAGYNTGCRIASAVANWSSKNSRIPYVLQTFLFYRKGGGEKKPCCPTRWHQTYGTYGVSRNSLSIPSLGMLTWEGLNCQDSSSYASKAHLQIRILFL